MSQSVPRQLKTAGGKAIEQDYQKPVTLILNCIAIAAINYVAITIYSGAVYNLIVFGDIATAVVHGKSSSLEDV